MNGQAANAFDPRLTALVVASTSFMASLDATIITLAMPHMADSFGVQPITVTIGITIYIVVMATIMPASAWIADRFGPRRVLAVAITGFTLASILCGISRSIEAFAAARALQAACAALMSPVGNQILFRVTPKNRIVTAVAISTTPALVAPVIGPPLGGMIITALSWPWIFFLNVPISLVAMGLTLRFIPRIGRAAPRPFDWRGFFLLGAAFACVIYGLEEAARLRGSPALPIGLIVAGIGFGVAAVRHMLTTPHPVVSLGAVRVRTFVATTLTGGVLVRIPFRGLNLILPLMLQGVLGFNAFWAGLLLLGYNGGDLALKAVAGRILRHTGFRSALTVSAVLTALATAGLMLIDAGTPWIVAMVALILAGAVRSVLFTGMMALTFADVPPDELPYATILNNIGAQVTGAFAVSFTALLLSGSAALRGGDPGHLALADYRAAMLAIAVIGLGAAWVFLRLPGDAGAEVSGHRTAG